MIRREEARAAARVYGGEYHCLEEKDLEIFYNRESLRKVCVLLRLVRPRLVITHSPVDYMVDHEQTSRIVRAACFNSTIPNAPAQPGAIPLPGIPHLYYADAVEGVDAMGMPVEPSCVVDVTAVIDRKTKALSCHRSQDDWLREQHGVGAYLDSMKTWTQERGLAAGLEYGEGFRQHLGHAYPRADLLGEALGGFVHPSGM